MEATRRQRVLRVLVLMLLGVLGGLLVSGDPWGSLRSAPFVLMALAMCAWTAAENAVLLRDEPKRYHGKRNTRLLMGAVILAVFTGVVDLVHLPPLLPRPAWLVGLGLAAIAAGASLRIAAIRALSRHFTYELRVEEGQPLVQTGPYRLLRHPSYLGILLVGVGAGLTLTSLLAALVGGGLIILLLALRIREEEAVLRASFGPAYDAYAGRTWRLLPFVY